MKSTRARLIVWNVVAIGLILAAMGLIVRYQLKAKLVGQIDAELSQEMAGINTPPKPLPETLKLGQANATVREIVRRKEARTANFYQVVKDDSGQASIGAEVEIPRLIPVRPDPVAHLKPDDPVGFSRATTGVRIFHDFMSGGKALRSVSEPVYSNGRIFAVAQAVRDLTPVNREMQQLDLVLAMLLPLSLLVAGIAGTMLVGSAMRPIRRLTESAQNLDPDLSGTRLPTGGGDEFAELARTFNTAFDRTAEAFDTQRKAMRQLEQFTADAGHELRTPLGAVKGSVSFMLQSRKWPKEAKTSLEIIDAASDRMNVLIQDLLLLARNEGNETPELAAVGVLSATEKALLLLPIPSGTQLQVCIEQGLTVQAEESGLIRVLSNLIGNAFSYGRSCVRVTARRTGQGVDITIEDDGEGIAPEHLPRIGERFYRPESARSRAVGGTGLGIAIAKSLISRYGGSLQIRSTVGVGTKVIVHLPAPRSG